MTTTREAGAGVEPTLPLLIVAGGAAGGEGVDWLPGRDASPAELLVAIGEARDRLRALLHRHGALLLRGLAIGDVADFERVCTLLGDGLSRYVGGDSPRHAVSASGLVYTSTEYASELEVGLHNEMSYAPWWPAQVYFWCRRAASSGGATHLADGRRVLATLPAALVERFERLGVTYEQHLPGAPGALKTWQQTFETGERAAVEAWCSANGVEYRWTRSGLSTRARRPGVLRHPVTGERAWFNQAHLWHAAAAGVKQRAAGGAAAAGCDACFGDGRPIGEDDLAQVAAALRLCERERDWRTGDLLLLDNLLTLHGRRAYTGPRSVLVAMA